MTPEQRPDAALPAGIPEPLRARARRPVEDTDAEPRGTVLLVTSARQGEGVTTIARRIALGVSHSAGDAIVVDTDLRARPTGARPGLPDAGLAEAIGHGTPLSRLIRKPFHGRLHGLAAGRGAESPTALLASTAFVDVLAELRDRYPWVILDGPPVTLHPETTLLARAADGVVLVVRAEDTRSQVAAQAERTLSRAGANLLGAVLNRRRHHIPGWLYRRL